MILRVIRTVLEGDETPTPTPSPTPTPTPTPTPSPTIQGAGCETLPIPSGGLPEEIAAQWRNGVFQPFVDWYVAIPQGAYYGSNFDPAQITILVNSPTPSFAIAEKYYERFPLPTCTAPFRITYSGTETPTTSVPGTVIEETPLPPPVMPPPVEPPVIQQCRQRIQEEIQQPVDETGYVYDRLKAQATGQIDYQLAQVEPALSKISQKIDSNIVNTMGEVYSAAYPIGLGIPTTEEIMEGTPVYSPYGIGQNITQVAAPYVPYCDELPGTTPSPTPTPTPTPTTGGGYPPPTTPPGVTCPAPVVQCPAPPAINVYPQITVNIPQQDGTDVTVNVDVPETPTTGGGYPTYEEPYEPEEEEEEEEVEVDVDIEAPTPSPTPSPTPTPDSCPVLDPPEKPPKEASLGLPRGVLPAETSAWGTGVPCKGSPGGLNPDFGQFWNFFGWTNVSQGEWKPPSYIDPDKYPTGFKWVGAFLMNAEGLLIDSTIKTFGASLPIANNFGDFLALAVGGFVQNWVGAPVLQFMQSNIYNINYNTPQRIPSEAEVVSLYLSGEITEETMRCLVRANGSYDTWYGLIAKANRTKLTNDQIIQLYRRDILPGNFADKLMRENGVLDQNEANMLYRASEAMPSVSDIVRFMVRDADDNNVAGKYGTDAQLDSKYSTQLKAWAKGQGITDETMKYYWRSHWEIPSNTALFEMLHRLRPARTGQGLTGGVTVSPSDIKDALVVNDVLPYWADRLIEISYKPLTRTDAQRAYFIDALSENELKDAYLDLGYNNDNADKLVRFTNQLKAKRKQTTGGTEKASSVLKYYKDWLIGDTEARQRLKNSGLSETAAVEALQIAGNQRRNDSQLACIKGVKSKYKRFIYGDPEARQDLIAIGVAIENIDNLVSQWNCERGNKPKELSAAQVCKAYKQELITEIEYLRRLQAIGYGRDEAGIIFELCTRPPAPKTTKAGAPITPKTQTEKDSQTAAARAVTQAALDALATGN